MDATLRTGSEKVTLIALLPRALTSLTVGSVLSAEVNFTLDVLNTVPVEDLTFFTETVYS
ncbi:hypothetical protein D1872_349860 [compost metagenome]